MFYHCKNESRELEVCGREYFRIRIPANSQTLPILEILRKELRDFPGGVGTPTPVRLVLARALTQAVVLRASSALRQTTLSGKEPATPRTSGRADTATQTGCRGPTGWQRMASWCRGGCSLHQSNPPSELGHRSSCHSTPCMHRPPTSRL